MIFEKSICVSRRMHEVITLLDEQGTVLVQYWRRDAWLVRCACVELAKRPAFDACILRPADWFMRQEAESSIALFSEDFRASDDVAATRQKKANMNPKTLHRGSTLRAFQPNFSEVSRDNWIEWFKSLLLLKLVRIVDSPRKNYAKKKIKYLCSNLENRGETVWNLRSSPLYTLAWILSTSASGFQRVLNRKDWLRRSQQRAVQIWPVLDLLRSSS